MSVHLADCMCPTCLMADMDAFVAAKGGTVYANEKTAPEKMRNKPAGQRSGRGYVRTISVAQQNLIKRLIVERDITGLTLLPGQTVNMAEIPTMGVKGGSALIEKLFNCPIKPNNSVRMATEGQLRFIRSLNEQAGNVISEDDIKTIEFAEVQEVLDNLKTVIANNKKNNVVAKTQVTEGAYWVDGKIARVQKSKRGYLYATLQIERGVNDFEYVKGLISKIKPEDMLTHEEMKAFAAEFSQCGDCGRKLTNPESIAYGIGPICRNKGYR